MMPTKPPNGLIPLRAGEDAVLKWAELEHDPVARFRARYRMIWNVVSREPSLAERIGGRLYIREAKVPDLADALGIAPASPRKARPARKPARRQSSSNAAVAA